MERVKSIHFAQSDLPDVFKHLGLPEKSNNLDLDDSIDPQFLPIIDAERLREEALNDYIADPSSSHTFKPNKSPKKST